MSVPKQVRRQVEAVKTHFDQVQSEADNADVSESVTAENTDRQVVNETTSVEGREQPSAGDREYEQKYKTLQGMYNSEVVAVKRENADLKSRLARLEELLATPTQNDTFTAQQFITPQDVEDYGDTIEVIRRAAREENQALAAELAAVKAELRKVSTVVPTVERVTRAQAESQEQIFWDRLTAAVPDWQSINNDPQFHDWLLEVDPISGLNKQVFLEEAQKRFDVNRIATFFNAWKDQTNAPKAQYQRDSRQSQLERQITPGRSRGNTRQPSSPRVYSRQDIATFYSDVRKGVYRGRDDERARIEADIFAAQAEGRVVAT
jgi:hypothetical protein